MKSFFLSFFMNLIFHAELLVLAVLAFVLHMFFDFPALIAYLLLGLWILIALLITLGLGALTRGTRPFSDQKNANPYSKSTQDYIKNDDAPKADYGNGACGIFRVKKVLSIAPDMLQVGIARAKQLENKLAVFGVADEGVFVKGDCLTLGCGDAAVQLDVLEAFCFDEAAVNGRSMEAVLEETLSANLRCTRKIEENREGWLVIDAEAAMVKNGTRLIKLARQ